MFNAPMKTRSAGAPMRAAALCALLVMGVVVAGSARAAVSEHKPPLTLVYDRTPAVCHALLDLYNRDLARKGYVDTQAHAVFSAIHWARLAGTPAMDNPPTQMAFFDINNDGHVEPVVRFLAYMGPRAEGATELSVLKATPSDFQQWIAWGRNPGKYVLAEFPPPLPAGPSSQLTGQMLFYILKHVPARPISTEARPFGQPAFPTAELALHPLTYRGTVYVSVSVNAEPGKIKIGGHFGRWVVIGKYRPDYTFEDVCYFRAERPPRHRR